MTPDQLVRPEVLGMSAYHVAEAAGMVKLDAMENPYPLPEPLRRELSQVLARVALNRYPIARMRDEQPALVFLAYPNNPTGVLYPAADVLRVIEAAPGMVVLDEAYHVFAGKTFMGALPQHKNLLVLRTVSKLGLAGIRLGYLAGWPEWVRELNKVRQVYNVNVLTEATATFMLEHLDVLEAQAGEICAERAKLFTALSALQGVTVFPSAANFFLLRVPDAARTYEALCRQGVLVRNLHPGLANCLRVTVGTPDENRILLNALKEAL